MSAVTEGFKKALQVAIQIAGNAVIAGAITALPLLGLPGFRGILTWIVFWVIGKLTPQLEVWMVDRLIEVQVDAEQRAYARAKEELKLVLSKHVKSEKEIQDASDDFDKRLADLIHFDS